MLKNSIIKQRSEEISECALQFVGPQYKKNAARADEFLKSLQKLIPEGQKKRASRLIDEYLGAEDRAGIELERVAYTQGLIDGVELAKIIMPVLKG